MSEITKTTNETLDDRGTPVPTAAGSSLPTAQEPPVSPLSAEVASVLGGNQDGIERLQQPSIGVSLRDEPHDEARSLALKEAIKHDRHVEDIEDRKQRRKGEETDRQLRMGFAVAILIIVVAQMAYVDVVFWKTGSGHLENLSLQHLMLLVGKTIAELIGIGYIIAKYLFPDDKE